MSTQVSRFLTFVLTGEDDLPIPVPPIVSRFAVMVLEDVVETIPATPTGELLQQAQI